MGPNTSGSEGQGGPRRRCRPLGPRAWRGVGCVWGKRPRRKWSGSQPLGARGEGDSGLHFPGGHARDRKCHEPINGRSGPASPFQGRGARCVRVSRPVCLNSPGTHENGRRVAEAGLGGPKLGCIPLWFGGESPGWEFWDLGSSAAFAATQLRTVAGPRSASVSSFRKWTPLSGPSSHRWW